MRAAIAATLCLSLATTACGPAPRHEAAPPPDPFARADHMHRQVATWDQHVAFVSAFNTQCGQAAMQARRQGYDPREVSEACAWKVAQYNADAQARGLRPAPSPKRSSNTAAAWTLGALAVGALAIWALSGSGSRSGDQSETQRQPAPPKPKCVVYRDPVTGAWEVQQHRDCEYP